MLRQSTRGSSIALLVVLTSVFAIQPGAQAALTIPQALQAVLADPSQIADGDVLFEETFESGALDNWRADAGWTVVDDPGGEGKCAQAISSEADHEDLVLNQTVPVVPGHPIAVLYKVRFVSGSSSMYLRVDFYDADGKQGEPYAHQENSREGDEWTSNTPQVSDWFPGYTRAMRIHFHHTPGANTTSLLDDIRIVDLARPVSALLAREMDTYEAMARDLSAAAADLPDSETGRYWAKAIDAKLKQARAQLAASSALEPGTDAYAEAVSAPMCTIQRLTDAVEALRAGKLSTLRCLAYATEPIDSRMVLPASHELPGRVSSDLAISACPGEYEPASIVLWAPEEINGLIVTASDLKGPQSAIPAGNIDIKWVKAWYQAGGAPYGITCRRDQKVLVSELLLKDDSLVKVDLENQHQHLKLSFPDGARYVPIDDPTVVDWGNRYTLDEYPVKDSETLLPTDLPEGENKQVWLTVKVPETAEPGVYTGQVAISSADGSLGEIELRVRVLPFRLADPRTHYDLDEVFTYSLYYWGELDSTGAGTIGYKYKSEEQFRAELRYMYEHGIVGPAMIWSPTWVYDNEEFFRRHLAIMQETGMAGRPLVMADSGLVANPTEPAELDLLKQRVRRTIEIAREYDFPGVYFYGLDEARSERLMSQMEAWAAVHEAGGKIFVSGYEGHLEQVGDVLDLFNRAGASNLARPAEWHKRGNKIWNYANPQTPVEDPAIYRRNYGLFLWGLDYDGACTYCFMDSSGRPWNDFDDKSYRDHNVAYPTVDGVVGTLAMQGFREGSDDVKYATTLRLAIQSAAASDNAAAKARAAKALEWLEGLDFAKVELSPVRERMIEEILALQDLGFVK